MTESTEQEDARLTPGEPWSGEHPDTHLEREDERWSKPAQLQDWLVLIVMIVIYLIWAGLIYFLEPGIR
jgi:hypothetical protein